jgi:hypothetical protein
MKSLLFEPGDIPSQRVVRSGFWVFALRIANPLMGIRPADPLRSGDFHREGLPSGFYEEGYQGLLGHRLNHFRAVGPLSP